MAGGGSGFLGRFSATIAKLTDLPKLLLAAPSSSSSTPQGDVAGLQNDLEYVQRILRRIKAVLADAEEREVRDESVRLWLSELQDLGYEADDLLDIYDYEVVAMEVRDREAAKDAEEGTTVLTRLGKRKSVDDQVCASITPSLRSPLQDPVFQKQVFDSVKKIKDRVEEIDKMKDIMHLKEHEGVRINKEIVNRQPTGSLPIEPEIIGRESDMSEVVTMLTSDDGTHVQTPTVVALVGMGGVGKTTLAQHVYNDPRVSNHFRMKGWVCVSDHPDRFDLISIVKKTLQAFTLQETGDLNELSAFQERLKRQVEGERFLLVMDDTWNGKSLLWDRFLSCLRCGATGSKILITTRSQQVVGATKATPINIGCLPEDSAWSLFRQYAFGRDDKSEDRHPVLVPIGREIAKKCGGLPLALRVLGCRLSDTPDDQLWRHVLENDLWERGIWEEDGKQILGPLLLSYLHLPAHLKPCLKICSVFPKDHTIHKGDLLSLWMAHDLIMVEDRDNWIDLKDATQKYIDNLVSRSFFQEAFHHEGPVEFVTMHDLIHDLTQFLSHSSIVPHKGGSIIPKSRDGNRRLLANPSQADLCHIVNWGCLRGGEVTEPMIRYKHIRSLNKSIPKSNMLRPICELYNLRELQYGIHGDELEVPEEIGNLKHLLHLGLGGVRSLPDSIGRLLKLQSLMIHVVGRFVFPKSIRYLTNLQEIFIHGFVYYFPVGIGRLRNLRRLGSYFLVPRISGQAGLAELRDLIYLEGSLEIEGLSNLLISEDAKQANLIQKKNLRELELSWGKFHLTTNEKDEFLDAKGRISYISADDAQRDEQVLENLRPHPNLQSLMITGWAGLKLPSWLTEDPPYLTQLTSLSLFWCERLDSLWRLGDMPRLVKLDIRKCRVDALPVNCFSTLKELNLDLCDHLASIPVYKVITLESLVVWKCPQLQSIYFDDPVGAFSSVLKEVELSNCKSLTTISLDNQVVLQSIKVVGCKNLELISIALCSMTALQTLEVAFCKNLKDIRLRGPLSAVVDINACLSKLVLLGCPLLQEVQLPYSKRGVVRDCGPFIHDPFSGEHCPIDWLLYDSVDLSTTDEEMEVEHDDDWFYPKTEEESEEEQESDGGGSLDLSTLPLSPGV